MTTVAPPPGAVPAPAADSPAADAGTSSTPAKGADAGRDTTRTADSHTDRATTADSHADRVTDRTAERATEAEVTESRTARQAKADQATPAAPAAKGEWRVEDLPTGAQKMIAELRKEAGDHRVAAKTAQEQAKETSAKLDTFLDGFARVMGLTQEAGPQEPPDPDKLTAELEQVQKSHRETEVRLAVYEAAQEHGGNPRALTDSVSFLNKVNKLDPGKDDFADKIAEAVRDAITSNPLFKAAGQAPAAPPAVPSGGHFAGGPGRSPDPESMSVEDFRKALKEGRRPT